MKVEKEISNLKERITKLENLISTFVINTEKSSCDQKISKKESSRDKTKYMFNNKIYHKNRLVLAIVKEYVKSNQTNFQSLQNVFDKSLQGSLNVVEEIDKVNLIKNSGKRYFTKPQDLITLKDGKTVAICTQWGIFNIVKFIKQSQNLGYIIETV